MTTKIWRYPLITTEKFSEIEMPQGAQILRLEMKDGQPNLWALISDTSDMEMRFFEVYATGEPIDNPLRLIYIGQFMPWIPEHSITLVWHLFENRGSLDNTPRAIVRTLGKCGT